MMHTILTTTTTTPMNASSISNGFGNTTGLFPVIGLLLYIVGALLAAQFVAPWLAKSELLSITGRVIFDSLMYAIKGFAASAVLLAVALPVYLVATADGGTRGVVLEYVGMLLAGYVGLVIVGMLADRAVALFIDAHPRLDEFADLFDNDELVKR